MLDDSVVDFDFRSIVCPTCDVDDTRVLGMRGGSAHRDGLGFECRIVKCRGCGLIYPNPFPFPRDLDGLYSESEAYFGNHRPVEDVIASRHELITELEALTSGRRLLEVGTGRGEILAAATVRGWDAHGIEPSAAFVKEAERLVPGRVFHGTLDALPSSLLRDGFDAVVLKSVLEHLYNPSDVLASIARVLRPGGIFFLDAPNEAGLYFGLGNLWMKARRRNWVVNLAPTFPPFHVFGYSKRSLTALLRRHGFQPVQWRFYGLPSPLPLRRSAVGVLEWTAGHVIATATRFGELGSSMECWARRDSGVRAD